VVREASSCQLLSLPLLKGVLRIGEVLLFVFGNHIAEKTSYLATFPILFFSELSRGLGAKTSREPCFFFEQDLSSLGTLFFFRVFSFPPGNLGKSSVRSLPNACLCANPSGLFSCSFV